MAIISKPKPVGLSDPSVLRKTQQNLAQAAELAKGKPTLTNNGQELILPSTTVAVSNSTVSATTSANNQPSDTVTVYSTPGNIFVSSIDQTVRSTTINQVGVSSIISGNNITISSTGNNGTGGVTINATASASLGNVTFDDINIIGTGNLHLQPDPANTGSYLDIFLTSGPDLHLVASASANLILGKDAGANVMTSWNGNVYIQSWDGSNASIWTFDNDGNLTLPGNIVMNDGINGTISSEGNVNVSANTNVWEFGSDGNLTLSDLGVIWDNGGLTTLQAGTDGAQIGSNDGQSYVIANTSGTYMQTLADSTNNIWTFALSGGYAPPILSAPPGTPVAGTYYTADGISWDPATKSGVVPYPVFYDGVAYQSLY